MKEQEINDISEMAKHLESICKKVDFYRSEYYKSIHEINSYVEYIECYNQQLLTQFTQETAGRSLSCGLSDTQIHLSVAIESLVESKNELDSVCKKVKSLNRTIDRLTNVCATIDTCLDVLRKLKILN